MAFDILLCNLRVYQSHCCQFLQRVQHFFANTLNFCGYNQSVIRIHQYTECNLSEEVLFLNVIFIKQKHFFCQVCIEFMKSQNIDYFSRTNSLGEHLVLK